MNGSTESQTFGMPSQTMGGFGQGGVLYLLLGALLPRLFNGDDNGNGGGYQAGVIAGTTAKYADLVNAQESLANVVISGNHNTQAQNSQNFQTLAFQIGGVKDTIQQLGCQNLLQGKDTELMMATQTATILADNNAQTQAILGTLANDREQALRDQLNETQRERDLLATGNFPVSQPAHLYRFGSNAHLEPNINVNTNENTNVNANLNANLNVVVNALAGLTTTVGQLSAKVDSMGK